MQELSIAEMEAVARNQAYINEHGDRLLSNFAPAFCFHKKEDSFPTYPEYYIKDVIMAKYNHYTINATKLTKEEGKELALIQKYFIKDRKFNPDYGPTKESEHEEYQKEVLENRDFLTFDEKKYGYPLGSKVPILGTHPHNKQEKAPIYTCMIPTPYGVRIKYEYFYAISSAIPGLKPLYENLPYSVAKKAKDFAVHAGDWEGVEIDVNIDPQTNKASINGMQTFAHGRDGARFVEAKDLTFNSDGRACAFVGRSTHASYADKFIGRNRFMDQTGNKYQIVPTEFVKLGPNLPKEELPRWAGFKRMGQTESMLHSPHSTAQSYQELKEKSKTWNRYKPILALTKAWNKICTLVGAKHNTPRELRTISLEKPAAVATDSTTKSKFIKRSRSLPANLPPVSKKTSRWEDRVSIAKPEETIDIRKRSSTI